MRNAGTYLTVALFSAASVLGVVAQQQGGGQQPASGEEVTLVYEREVYTYRGGERRDPFQPLTEGNQMGPRFQELMLQGIIYSAVPGESVVLLRGGEDRVFRARVGDVVGNSRVIEITPTRVIMAVENFGSIRQEILELPQRGGADR